MLCICYSQKNNWRVNYIKYNLFINIAYTKESNIALMKQDKNKKHTTLIKSFLWTFEKHLENDIFQANISTKIYMRIVIDLL